jgi:hypothetical protein
VGGNLGPTSIKIDAKGTRLGDNIPVGVEGQGGQEGIPIEALEGDLRIYEV